MGYKKRIADLNILNSVNNFDVCVIGAGPTGITLSKILVENGLRTVILESGSDMSQWLFNQKLRRLAAYDFTGNTNYPLTKTKSRLIGGNSNFWTGRCERFTPSDFEAHPYTPPNNPWPVSYEEMDPYYERAENLFRVRGDQPSKYAPPRKSPYPLPFKPDVSYLKNLMSRAGIVADDSPTATPSKTIRFFKAQEEILSTYGDSQNLTIIKDATVTRLITDSSQSVVGAEASTLEGERKIVKAKIFIVTTGGIETPRLLLLSKSEYYPDGIGNHYDRVGRGFNEHPAVNYYGKIKHEWGTIYPSNKIVRTRQFYDTFRKDGLGSILPVIRQAWLLPHHISALRLVNIPRNIIAFLGRVKRATLYMGATIEQEINDENRVTLSTKNKDIFGNPIAHLTFNFSEKDLLLLDRCRDLILGIYSTLGATSIYEADITFSRHHQGTCRIGNNPKTSVANRNLRVHDTKNLYLCGSEVFVTGGAMPPLLSALAFANRLGDYIVKEFKKGTINKMDLNQDVNINV